MERSRRVGANWCGLGRCECRAGAGAGEGGNCFSGETVVATSSGEKPISEIHIGEKVWSRDEATGERELRPVVEKFVTPGRALIDLDIAAGAKDEVVRTTPTHRFWVDDRGWTEAQALRAGDAFDLYMGSHAVLVQSVRETETSTVYNIEVEGTHTYFVGELGVWVHNACGPSAKPNWPPNNGFAEGSGGDVTVLPNQILDRYGDPGGGFLAPAGTPFAERALPDGYDSKPLNSYFVAQPFTAAGGQSAPAFGQPGGGIQFYLGSSTVQDLVDRGILIPWSGEL